MVDEIPLRPLGATGAMVSAIGLGGYHIGKMTNQRDAIRLVHAAIDGGISFMDNAWEYHDGRSEVVMGKAIRDRRDRVFLMTKVCTHGRGKREAMRQLEQSLRRLKTDWLDLWQVHECVYDNDPELHFASGGVIEALDLAKRQGKVRFVGFTGHKHPDIHLAMLKRDYIFDTCQLPLNCFDASFRSFEEHVLPLLRAPRHRCDRHEEPEQRRPAGEGQGRHGGGGAALRDEPAGRDHGQRHRFDAGAAAEPARRAGLQADVDSARWTRFASACATRLKTGATSCTRRPRRTTAR